VEGERKGGRQREGRKEKVKEQKREGTRVTLPLAKRAAAAKVDYYCAPSCSLLTALGQVNLCRQAALVRSLNLSRLVSASHPKTIAALVSGSRQEGSVVGSTVVWAAWAAWAVEWPVPQVTGLITGLTGLN
jgi:hypothetical protein